MACSFAPHNITEIMDAIVYLTENPGASVNDLLRFVKGPDFPTGGTVINKDELTTAHEESEPTTRLKLKLEKIVLSFQYAI